MVRNLFPQFLEDPEQYRLSERYWEDLWGQIDPFHRANFEWIHPWLGTGSPDIKDGNPVFSAYSPVLGRGVRIIQQAPIESGLDIQVWLDTFGGEITNPDRIHELVISCALSDVASKVALTLMSSWVRGQSLSFRRNEAGLFLPSDSKMPRREVRSFDIAA